MSVTFNSAAHQAFNGATAHAKRLVIPGGLTAPIVLAKLSTDDSPSITSVAADDLESTPLTFVGKTLGASANSVYVYVLINPPVTGGGGLLFTYRTGSSVNSVLGIDLFDGVDQVTPCGLYVGATGVTSGGDMNAHVDITGLSTDMLSDVVAPEATATVGGSQTESYHDSSFTEGAGSYLAATGSVQTMTWALATIARNWAIGAVPLHAVGLTGAAGPFSPYKFLVA